MKVGRRNKMTPDPFASEKSTNLADSNVQLPKAPLSEQITQTRALLLTTFQNQLAQPLTERLVSEKKGVPFLYIDNDPPQIAAIKKVVNCLYHAEQAAIAWEKTNYSSAWQKAVSAPKTLSMLNQLYKAVALLNDATPEIQTIVTNNYAILNPVFSSAYEIIQSYGWSPQMSDNEVIASANSVLDANEDAVMVTGNILSDREEALNASGASSESNNPLISVFTNLSQLLNVVADLQQPNLSTIEQRSKFEIMHHLLEKLDTIPFMNQLSLAGAGDSMAFKRLMDWLALIDDDDVDFTQKSMQGYITWANNYLPSFINYVDQLEQTNYLKSGLLSKDLFSALNRVKDTLAESPLTFNEKLITVESLAKTREAQIDVSQVAHVKAIVALEAQQRDIEIFVGILKKYAGQSFSAITEKDRHEIRQIYPNIQHCLAHQSLELEHELTNVLNERGGIEESSWTKWTLNKLGAGVGYFAPKNVVTTENNTWTQWTFNQVGANITYWVGSHVDKFIAAKNLLHSALDKQIDAEKLKMAVAENARDTLNGLDETPILERVEQQINKIKSDLSTESQLSVVNQGDIVAVKASSLKNLRGNIAYLQELQLSETVHKTRDAFSAVLKHRLNQVNAAYFTAEPPYDISPNESELVQQVKHLENSLLRLEQALQNFERLKWDDGYRENYRTLRMIDSSARELFKSIQLLSPEAKKYVTPVLQQLNAYGSVLSTVTQKNGDLSSLAQLQKMDTTIELNSDFSDKKITSAELEQTEDVMSSKQSEIANKEASFIPNYRAQIEEARAKLLKRLQENLATPFASKLTPQPNGVPFIHLNEDAPQVAAFKKVINSLYYAEKVLQTIEHINTKTELDKVLAMHQGVAAVSQLYKSLSHLTDAAPEVQNLVRDNYDLLEPVFNHVSEVFNNSAWLDSFKNGELGRFVGRGINAILPGNGQSFTVTRLFADFPSLLHQIREQMQSGSTITAEKLRISERRIKAIDSVIDMVAKDKISLVAIAHGRDAYEGLVKLSSLLAREGNELQKSTLHAYQQWVKESYPDLLMMLDDLEARYYLQPGILSKPISTQVDAMSQYINDISAKNTKYKKYGIKPIQLSADVAPKRAENLGERRQEQWIELFKIEQKKQAASNFFSILDKYQGKSFSDLSFEDRLNLKEHFVEIQQAMAYGNVALTNKLINAFNQSDTMLKLDQIVQQKTCIDAFLMQEEKACQLKIDVVTEALAQHRPFEPGEDARMLEQAHRDFYQQQKPVVESEQHVLTTIDESSIGTIRISLENIQKLELSFYVAKLREQFKEKTQSYLSPQVQQYLKQLDSHDLHVIDANEPSLVRQVKELENNLYHLQAALVQFEQLKTSDRLLAQAKIFVQIGHHAQELANSVQQLSPELKEQYGSLVEQMLSFSDKVQALDYKNAYTADMKKFLEDSRKKPTLWLTKGAKVFNAAATQLDDATALLKESYESYALREDEEEVADFDELNFSFSNNALVIGNKGILKRVYVDLANHMKQFEQNVDKLGQEIKNSEHIKQVVYGEFLVSLSQQEDALCLKPGTLLKPAMAAVNQFFLSMALELNMPFKEKLKLLNEKNFINIISDASKKKLNELELKFKAESGNPDLELQIAIKRDKINFLAKQKELFAHQDPLLVKCALLDSQFNAYLRNHMNESGRYLSSPIYEQYERALQTKYEKDKVAIVKENPDALSEWMIEWNRHNFAHYWFVSKGIEQLGHLQEIALKEQKEDVRDYIDRVIITVKNEAIPIALRGDMMKQLPHSASFNRNIGSLSNGMSHFDKFKLFIKTAASSVVEAINTGGNVFQIYEKKKAGNIIKNIEKFHTLKKELNSMKTSGVEEQKNPEETFSASSSTRR